ncbi:COX15/CtaA family protein [Planctomyces sp. SH-PL62]|uniref:COX15/CtaA family protein n=1 Tax=Planctomyces sp. SH-PL62 TaxID=1636152 RepID=UPI00078B7966|nr:COX15/CtaA family protein [Planctomyces sp. SH-PL62]AMV36672.1 Heme A synthase [Planctomyces sp. SH-PL62]
MTNLNTNPAADRSPGYRRAPHWAAVLAAVFTLPLLYVGGSVTTYRVGMAVPDWPTTFGMNMFLYDFWNAPFGVQVEHSHRLYGAAVGVAMIALCAWFFLHESRRWMKVFGLAALVMVIVQGLLGGYRVTQNSTTWAAVHGCLGQVFFATTVALATFTGRDWLSDAKPTPDAGGVRKLAVITLLLIAAQIGLGAWVRHFSGQGAAVFHGIVGTAILGVAAHLYVKTKRLDPPKPSLRSAARVQEILAGVQILLGVASFVALWPFDGTPRVVGFYQAVVRTVHQTNGAVLLAASVVATLRAFRHFGPTSATSIPSSPSSSTSEPTDLEVVA